MQRAAPLLNGQGVGPHLGSWGSSSIVLFHRYPAQSPAHMLYSIVCMFSELQSFKIIFIADSTQLLL